VGMNQNKDGRSEQGASKATCYSETMSEEYMRVSSI